MRILKFLSGGTPTLKPITDPFKAQAASNASASAAASKKSGSGLISDDLMKRLYDNGIPSDVDDFLLKVGDLESDQSLGIPVSAGTVRKLEALGNRVIQQAKYLKNAEDAAAKNDSLGEIAVGSRGELFVADKTKGVKQVSLKEFDANKMTALTVGELIEARKFSPSQAWNESIIPVVGRNLGLSKINEYIQNIIKTVGSNSTTQEAYVDLASYVGKEAAKKPSEFQLEQLQGLHNLMEKVGPDAIFKNKQVMQSKNMEAALAYISSVLPADMKRQLISRSVAEGNSYQESVNNIGKLITLSFLSGNDTKYEDKIDYDSSINKAAGTTAGEKESGKTFYQRPNEALFDGDLNQTVIELTDNAFGNQTGIKVKGTRIPALTTDDGNAVNNLPLGIALNQTIGKYLEKDKIFMGDQKVSEGMLNDIAYSNDPGSIVYVPVDGRHNIDWKGFHGFSAAEKEIRENHITAIPDKNKVHQKYGSYAHYADDGSIVPDTITEQYFLTYGYTIDDKVDDDNSMVQELDGDAEDEAERIIDSVYTKAVKNKYGISDIDGRQFWDDIFRVPIFIKVNEFASQDAYRYGGHGSSLKPRTLEQDMLQQQIQQEPKQLMFGNSDLLYQE